MVTKAVAKLFSQSMSPDNLIELGHLLVDAGNAAKARQAAIERALEGVRQSVQTLTD